MLVTRKNQVISKSSIRSEIFYNQNICVAPTGTDDSVNISFLLVFRLNEALRKM